MRTALRTVKNKMVKKLISQERVEIFQKISTDLKPAHLWLSNGA